MFNDSMIFNCTFHMLMCCQCASEVCSYIICTMYMHSILVPPYQKLHGGAGAYPFLHLWIESCSTYCWYNLELVLAYAKRGRGQLCMACNSLISAIIMVSLFCISLSLLFLSVFIRMLNTRLILILKTSKEEIILILTMYCPQGLGPAGLSVALVSLLIAQGLSVEVLKTL